MSTSDGRVLTVVFTAAVDGADKPCGEDYWAEPVYSAHGVVLVLHGRGYTGDKHGGMACLLIGRQRQVTLELTEPLGNRVVLEGMYGRLLPVTAA